MSAAIDATRAATVPWLPSPDPAPSSEVASRTASRAYGEPRAEDQAQPLPSIFSFFAPASVSEPRAEDQAQPLPSIFSFFAPAAVSEPRAEDQSQPLLSIFSFFPPAAAPELATAAPAPTRMAPSQPAKSWYRAPYKSPFDPAFWMSPGHPADHLPVWMAITGLSAMMPGTAMAPTGWPTLQTPWIPALPAINPWTANPWASNPVGSNPWAANPWTTSLWSDAGQGPNPWTAWLDASTAGWSAIATPPRQTSNVVDFSAAYAAYRTAGGHASAQLSHDRDVATAARDRQSQPGRSAVAALPFDWPTLMWPWLPKH